MDTSQLYSFQSKNETCYLWVLRTRDMVENAQSPAGQGRQSTQLIPAGEKPANAIFVNYKVVINLGLPLPVHFPSAQASKAI